MTTAVASSSRGQAALRIALWVAQVLLAFAFLGAGFMKLTTPFDVLSANPQMGWALDVGAVGVKLIGALEVAGALGLILPSVTRILPFLTPLAAAGLVLTMVCAAALHLVRGEYGIAPSIVLGGIALFIAWGRFKKAPIAPRA